MDVEEHGPAGVGNVCDVDASVSASGQTLTGRNGERREEAAA